MRSLLISIVIPARNEEKTIGEVITGCKPYGDEILVVTNNSQDRTKEIARNLGAKVIFEEKVGKGYAVRAGIDNARGDIIVFMDADGSHDPNDIPKLIKPIVEGKVDLVIGSRMRGGSDELHGDIAKFIRMIASDIITLSVNYRFGVRLTDIQNGFRAIKTKVVKALNLKENIHTIEQEMTIKALRKGYRVAEVPSHEYARKFGSSTIKLNKMWFRYFYSWLRYLFFD